MNGEQKNYSRGMLSSFLVIAMIFVITACASTAPSSSTSDINSNPPEEASTSCNDVQTPIVQVHCTASCSCDIVLSGDARATYFVDGELDGVLDFKGFWMNAGETKAIGGCKEKVQYLEITPQLQQKQGTEDCSNKKTRVYGTQFS